MEKVVIRHPVLEREQEVSEDSVRLYARAGWERVTETPEPVPPTKKGARDGDSA